LGPEFSGFGWAFDPKKDDFAAGQKQAESSYPKSIM